MHPYALKCAPPPSHSRFPLPPLDFLLHTQYSPTNGRTLLAVLSFQVRLPQSFHDERSTGELASRLQSDCIKLGDVLSLNVNIVLRQLLQAQG